MGSNPTLSADTIDAQLYSSSMTVRVGPKGQIVIPKAIRDQASIEPGDEVEVHFTDETIVVVPRRRPARLGGRFARTGMAERLLDDRRSEPR